MYVWIDLQFWPTLGAMFRLQPPQCVCGEGSRSIPQGFGVCVEFTARVQPFHSSRKKLLRFQSALKTREKGPGPPAHLETVDVQHTGGDLDVEHGEHVGHWLPRQSRV